MLQLKLLRQALAAVTLVRVDDRDAEAIERMDARRGDGVEAEPQPPAASAPAGAAGGAALSAFGHPPTLERVPLSKRCRLSTIDNFQGEEAAVVIVSLVRNNPKGRLGFLASPNRCAPSAPGMHIGFFAPS